jgi:lipopolysaccharide biosynthesis glycosyltransferase
MKNTPDVRIYLGYDTREKAAFNVCRYSILKHNKDAVVVPISKNTINEYRRPVLDPESTEFTYARFLAPYLMGFKGYSIFLDADFVLMDDIHKVFHEIDRDDWAVAVVKHPPYVPHSKVKMDGIAQHAMYRKNWASFMVFNNEHPALQVLTPEYINTCTPGKHLHQFMWLSEYLIADLPIRWNVLDGYYTVTDPKAIHYTDGGPWFADHQESPYADVWKQLRREMQDAPDGH